MLGFFKAAFQVWKMIAPMIEQIIAKFGPIGQAIAAALAAATSIVDALAHGASIQDAILQGLKGAIAEVLANYTGGPMGKFLGDVQSKMMEEMNTMLADVASSTLPDAMKTVLETSIKQSMTEIASPMFQRRLMAELINDPRALTDERFFTQMMASDLTTADLSKYLNGGGWDRMNKMIGETVGAAVGSRGQLTLNDFTGIAGKSLITGFTPHAPKPYIISGGYADPIVNSPKPPDSVSPIELTGDVKNV
jgi:hypothetical protein